MRNLSKNFRFGKRDCGMEVMRARLLFARQLVMDCGVPYVDVWRYAGFSSLKDMERHWERMFRC